MSLVPANFNITKRNRSGSSGSGAHTYRSFRNKIVTRKAQAMTSTESKEEPLILGLDVSCRRKFQLLDDIDSDSDDDSSPMAVTMTRDPQEAATIDKGDSFSFEKNVNVPCQYEDEEDDEFMSLDVSCRERKVRLPTIETLLEAEEEEQDGNDFFGLNSMEDHLADDNDNDNTLLQLQPCKSEDDGTIEGTIETEDDLNPMNDHDCETLSCEDGQEHLDDIQDLDDSHLQRRSINIDSSLSSSLKDQTIDATQESLDTTYHRTNTIGIMLAA